MSKVSVLDVSESVCYDLRAATDAIYNLYETYFCFANEPERYKTDYDEISIRLRAAWLLLDYALRDLEGAHGILEDRRLEYLHTVMYGDDTSEAPKL